MDTRLLARIFLDTLTLVEAEIDTPEKAEEFKAIVFNSPEGEDALEAFEGTLGLALVPEEVVVHQCEFGAISIELAKEWKPSALEIMR